jgi:hypothetical protein
MVDLIYEVTVSGVVGDTVGSAFDDCELERGCRTTTVRCSADALLGVLDRIQDLGLDLVELISRERPPSRG